MAVTTTPRMLLTAALAKSSKNKGSTLAATDEVLQLVIRLIRQRYSEAARLNPDVFGVDADVPYASPGWARPADAEVVSRLERSGEEVYVVPFSDRTLMAPEPAVYERAGVFRSAGNAYDPTSGTLTFFYSKRPTDPATIDDLIDGLWPEQFNELLINEIAVYLATKDGNREDELAAYAAALTDWEALWTAHLEQPNVTTRRYSQVRGISIPLVGPTAPVPSRQGNP